jgi:hypothetical protein
MVRKISSENKQIAFIVDDAFGGDWEVAEYSDLDEERWLSVLKSPDRPEEGLISFSTIGLSDFQPPGTVQAQPPLGVEIAAVSQREEYAKVLAATGFYAIGHGWLLSPGTA